ncbi:MAG: kynureninase [Gammaproteobacteria bacterium]|nr:kynureninase [Gammaproteobacteria bacterium]
MDLETVKKLDTKDPLAKKREEFFIPKDKIYLDGNSLGPLTLVAKHRAIEVVEKQWGHELIASWNLHNWIDMPINVGEKIAPLIGAKEGQTICCDSVSINLFKLLACALGINSERESILSTRENFPTDLYIAEGLQRLLGDGRCHLDLVEKYELEARLKTKPAVLLLTHTDFRTGELFEIERLTKQAHANGTLVIWDLSHSVGVFPLELDKWEVDFAVGCSYKFLNGGPGSPAFLYVADQHIRNCENPISGWMGHKSPFTFEQKYKAHQGMAKFLSGTPPILSMAMLDAALESFKDIDIKALRIKSIQLTELFLSILQENGALDQLRLCSPSSANSRGSQLAFSHKNGFGICQALAAKEVIADFRSPNLLRFGFSPLHLRFADIWQSCTAVKEVLEEGMYLLPDFNKHLKVT